MKVSEFIGVAAAPGAPVAPKNEKNRFPPIDFPVPEVCLFAPPYNAEESTQKRTEFVTRLHTIPDKMLLYNSSTKGELENLKSLLTEKGLSVSEEVSKEGHYWTVLHYAAHYGHIKVVEFLLGYLQEHSSNFEEVLNLQTICGKTPLTCAIMSGDIKDLEVKKEIIKMLFDTNCINLTLRKASGEDMLELAQKNSLKDFIIVYCLRED